MDACPGPASPQTFHTDVPNPDCPECGRPDSDAIADMDPYLDVDAWQRAISDRIEGGDEIVTDPRGRLVWRSMLEHVGYGQDVGDDGVETLAEATIDHEGVMHVRTVRLDDGNAEPA